MILPNQRLFKPWWVFAGAVVLAILAGIPSVTNVTEWRSLEREIHGELQRLSLLNQMRSESTELIHALLATNGPDDSGVRRNVNHIITSLRSLADSVEAQQNNVGLQNQDAKRNATFYRVAIDTIDGLQRALVLSVANGNESRLSSIENARPFLEFTRIRRDMLLRLDSDLRAEHLAISRTEEVIQDRSVQRLELFVGFWIAMGILAILVYRNALTSLNRQRWSDTRLNATLDSIGDALWSIDRQYKTQFYNAACDRELGRSGISPVTIGGDARLTVPEVTQQWWTDFYDRVLRGDTLHIERQSIIELEPRPWFEISGAPIFEGSNVIGAVMVLRNITDRKLVERQLVEEREKAEVMNRLKSSFLANMSHELRTPMNGVLGYANLIEDESTEPLIRTFAEQISVSGSRLLRTLNSILDLSRIESGLTSMSASEFDLLSLIRQEISTIRPIAHSRNIHVLLQSSLETCSVHLDPDYVIKIVTNLIGNAVKFCSQGGVDISVEPDSRPGRVMVAVHDTGIGIDEAFLGRVFEEFQQESTGIARDYEGSGLGLAIVKRCVDALGGEISVRSQKQMGTTFTVSLPTGLSPQS